MSPVILTLILVAIGVGGFTLWLNYTIVTLLRSTDTEMGYTIWQHDNSGLEFARAGKDGKYAALLVCTSMMSIEAVGLQHAQELMVRELGGRSWSSNRASHTTIIMTRSQFWKLIRACTRVYDLDSNST